MSVSYPDIINQYYELNYCSYISMESIHFRANVLSDVAAAMIQWNKLTYNHSGSLFLDDDCNVTDLSSAKIFEPKARLKILLYVALRKTLRHRLRKLMSS